MKFSAVFTLISDHTLKHVNLSDYQSGLQAKATLIRKCVKLDIRNLQQPKKVKESKKENIEILLKSGNLAKENINIIHFPK